MRQAEELSITNVPTSANFWAYSSETLPPAENNAASGFAAMASSIPTTGYCFPLNSTFLPIDFEDHTGIKLLIGNPL